MKKALLKKKPVRTLALAGAVFTVLVSGCAKNPFDPSTTLGKDILGDVFPETLDPSSRFRVWEGELRVGAGSLVLRDTVAGSRRSLGRVIADKWLLAGQYSGPAYTEEYTTYLEFDNTVVSALYTADSLTRVSPNISPVGLELILTPDTTIKGNTGSGLRIGLARIKPASWSFYDWADDTIFFKDTTHRDTVTGTVSVTIPDTLIATILGRARDTLFTKQHISTDSAGKKDTVDLHPGKALTIKGTDTTTTGIKAFALIIAPAAGQPDSVPYCLNGAASVLRYRSSKTTDMNTTNDTLTLSPTYTDFSSRVTQITNPTGLHLSATAVGVVVLKVPISAMRAAMTDTVAEIRFTNILTADIRLPIPPAHNGFLSPTALLKIDSDTLLRSTTSQLAALSYPHNATLMDTSKIAHIPGETLLWTALSPMFTEPDTIYLYITLDATAAAAQIRWDALTTLPVTAVFSNPVPLMESR